ncbi:hypothetical protein Tco_0328282 [Tanacetum coccineum]
MTLEDLQLGIESYQTKLNLTQLSWDAKDFFFKEDYTIVSKPRAIIYRDRNNQKKMMREIEVHKFSDGTLTRILEKLDHMVKDYVLFKFNPSMEHRIWSEDDKRRSKEFINVIERRLKIRRIFRNLESFVSRRVFPTVVADGRRQVRFITTCSYSTDTSKDIMKAQFEKYYISKLLDSALDGLNAYLASHEFLVGVQINETRAANEGKTKAEAVPKREEVKGRGLLVFEDREIERVERLGAEKDVDKGFSISNVEGCCDA